MELIELWEGEECLYDNNADARRIIAFTFMLTTTQMKVTSNIGAQNQVNFHLFCCSINPYATHIA